MSVSRNWRWPTFSFADFILLWSPLRWFRNCHLFLALGPDDESVIYISEPAYRFVCHLFYCFLRKILHEEIRNYRRKWWFHCYLVLCSYNSQSEQKYVDVSTSLNNTRTPSSKWWLRSSSESTIGTLVNRDTTSKLTIRSSGCTCRDSNIWKNWKEFFTWCDEFPVSWLRSPAKYL